MLTASVEISRDSLTCFQCVEQVMLMGGQLKLHPSLSKKRFKNIILKQRQQKCYIIDTY